MLSVKIQNFVIVVFEYEGYLFMFDNFLIDFEIVLVADLNYLLYLIDLHVSVKTILIFISILLLINMIVIVLQYIIAGLLFIVCKLFMLVWKFILIFVLSILDNAHGGLLMFVSYGIVQHIWVKVLIAHV